MRREKTPKEKIRARYPDLTDSEFNKACDFYLELYRELYWETEEQLLTKVYRYLDKWQAYKEQNLPDNADLPKSRD